MEETHKNKENLLRESVNQFSFEIHESIITQDKSRLGKCLITISRKYWDNFKTAYSGEFYHKTILGDTIELTNDPYWVVNKESFKE